MSSTLRTSAALLLLSLAASAPALGLQTNGTAPSADPLPPLAPAITRAELEHHVRFLAADELRGRFTGTPEAVRAARYLAAVLKASGVEPAGDDGTFLQTVPFERSRATAAPELVVTTKAGAARAAVYGVDFEFPPTLELSTATLNVVVVRTEADLPKDADPATALFVDGTASERKRLLGPRRAAGRPDLLVAPGRTRPGEAGVVGDAWGRPQAPRSARETWLTLNGDLLAEVRSGAVASLRLTTHVQREALPTYNVVGLLRGAGAAALAKEAVVLSAHYDHLPARDGGRDEAGHAPSPGEPAADLIFNGADDDASGCSAVLELAGHFGAGPKPARTLVFLLATGEEIGLVGTRYYLDHPAVPLEQTVANLNFEMIGRPDEKVGGPGKLWLTGFELSNLGAACAEAQLAVAIDPRPEENFFGRSDNIAFVLRGIVGQTFSTYNLHRDYHHVTDEADTLDYAHMEQCVRTSAEAVGLVASGKLRPAWLEGKDPNARRPDGERDARTKAAPKAEPKPAPK